MSAFRKKSLQTGISSGNGLNKCLGKMFDLPKIHCIFLPKTDIAEIYGFLIWTILFQNYF